jgi:hypothetical protein
MNVGKTTIRNNEIRNNAPVPDGQADIWKADRLKYTQMGIKTDERQIGRQTEYRRTERQTYVGQLCRKTNFKLYGKT